MIFRNYFSGLLFVLLTNGFLLCAEIDRDVLFQTSTISALIDGVYDGDISCGRLKEAGDFGIGTYQALDGEMILLDDLFYQVRADGKVYPVGDEMKTPFAAVTFFDADKSISIQKNTDLKQLYAYLDSLLPSKNIFYAFKISGFFRYIKTRSVPAQMKPYPKLTEVTKHQPVFEFENIEGTILGYKIPSFADKINVIGYHLHFLSADKACGGHLLEMTGDNLSVEIDYTNRFYLSLPENSLFYGTDLEADRSLEIEKVEK